MRETYAPQQFSTLLMGSFALFAATLAAVGLYGVVHLTVAARTRETRQPPRARRAAAPHRPR